MDEKWPGGPVHADMDFAANTHIIAHAGRYLATVESGPLPYELSGELDVLGPYDFAGTLPGGFAAHTKLDHATGELHAIAYYWAWDHVQHVIIGAGGTVSRTTDIPVADGPMMHDFALAQGYVVLLDLPVSFEPAGRGIGRGEAALHLEPRPPGPGRPAAPRRRYGPSIAGLRSTSYRYSTPSTPTTTTAGSSSTWSGTKAPTTCPN